MRILLIEDDESNADLVRAGLRNAGFAVDHVGCAADGLAAVGGVDYDAVLLDLGLPDEDGMTLLRRLRAARCTAPVMILTARGRIDARIEGLDAGADDYVVKPVDPGELAARVRALVRRPRAAPETKLVCGNLTFDPARREVAVDGRPMPLSRRELGVLECLLRAAGRTVAKPDIEDRLYGFEEELASNSVEVHVHRLRRRMAESGATARIETRRGFGYALVPPA